MASGSSGEVKVKFEDILQLVGGGGRWQLVVFLWTVLGAVLSACHNLSSVFLGATPDHHCSFPGSENVTEAAEIADWIPRQSDGSWASCERYVQRGSTGQVEPCSNWVYQLDQYRSTIVSQWDLVCNNKWLLSTVQASYMFGIFCGSVISGIVSDQFGRKRTVCIFGISFIVCSVTAAFSNNYSTFIALRFFTAMSGAAVFGCSFILIMEVVGPQYRAFVGLVYQIPFAVGFMLLPGVAYFVRAWRHLQLAISVPSVLFLINFWVLPESPRWLILQGRFQEALDVCKFAATRNHRHLPDDQRMLKMMADFRDAEVGKGASDEDSERSVLQSCGAGVMGVYRLIGTSKMRRISLSSFYNWLVVAMIYYGVSFDSAQLSSSPYLAIFLAGLVEIPAYLMAVPLINRIGRRIGMIGAHLLTAAAILCIMAVPEHSAWPKLTLGMLGKFSSSAGFGIIYLYTAEYFPTTMRNVGFGASSTCARIGSMSAPYIVDLLSQIHWSIPSCVFGVCAVSAALVALLLPETNNRRLPETLEDIELDRWELMTSEQDGAPPDEQRQNNSKV